jgi:hypothetical protein
VSDEAELSDYLLGELAPQERTRFEERLSRDAALRARVEELRPLVGELQELPGEAWALLPAPIASASRAEDGPPLRGIPAGLGAQAAQRGRDGALALTRRPWLAAVAAFLLICVGFLGGWLVDPGRSQGGHPAGTPPTVIALGALDGAPKSSSALARMRGDGEMVLAVQGLAPVKPGAYYEVWLMTDLRHLVPVASFAVDADGRARIEVPLPAPPSDYRYLDISLQSTSAGTAHSADSVLRGSLS